MILPARIGGGDLILRPLRLRDCRRFLSLDRESGPGLPVPVISGQCSWPGLWLRLRRRLDLCYGIEVNGAACGLIGLYDLTPEGLAHVALAIFDRSARGKGIGSRAFSLLTDMLRSHPVARLLLAEVKEHDEAAVRFWTKQGFAQTAAGTGGTIIVSLDLCGGA